MDLEKPLLILVHGWGSNHGTMARLADPLLEGGFPVLLFDVRHHGKSRGAPYVTARHFRDDIKAAVEKGRELYPNRPVVLVGHSMGGSTSVLAAADGAPVNGLISIGAPADLWDVWAYHLSRKGLPGRWVIRAFSPFWRARAGVPWDVLDPRRQARHLAIPFLVIHGEEDESVALSHAEALGQAGNVEPHLVSGQGHTELLDHSETHRLILKFLNALSGPTSSV
jgi:pimeloyl-ACP methyl ester carboxylesterase